ncbi:MAG TPA: ABC transporter substrate-binding protein [Desulfovibrio sp.]|nr:ABC transporter substrate-binding protein [Desulfovibrio sp.]
MKTFLIKAFLAFTMTVSILTATITAAAPLTVTLSPAMPPLSFVNSAGEADGLLVDFWKEWGEQADREIIFKLQSWCNTISDTVAGKSDIHSGLFYSEKRARQLLFADYIFPMEAALFAPNKLIEDNKIDLQKYSCGLVKGGFGKEFISRRYPYTHLTIFNSIADLFEAVREGRISLFLMDYPVGIWQLEKMGLADSFGCYKKLYKRNLYPAVSKNNPGLIKVINLNMAAIPYKKKKTTISKWLSVPTTSQHHRTIAGVLAGLVFVLMVIFHRNEIKTMAQTVKNKFSA